MLPSLVPACSPRLNPLCCQNPDDPGIEDPATYTRYFAAKGAAGHLSTVAQRSFDEVVIACQNLAVDLDAPEENQARIRDLQGPSAASAWCDLAVAQINGQLRAKGRLVVTLSPPRCKTSAAAKASCQALCAANSRCDLATSPPRCDGGKLSISCQGSCSAQGGAEVACEGACEGTCQGACVSPSGVACEGTCQGTCEAGGRLANGTCKGICKGTCSAVAPGASCSGTCAGACRGTCKATGTIAAQCDGACDGPSTALACEGGKLVGGCSVDPKCDANCDASVAAKAECTPSEISIQVPDGIPPKYTASLKTNLRALVLVAQGRGPAFVDLMARTGGGLVASVEYTGPDSQVFGCLDQLATKVTNGIGPMDAAVRAAGKVLEVVRRQP